MPRSPLAASPLASMAAMERWLLGGWLILPYASYLAMVGLAIFLVDSLRRRSRKIFRLLWQGGWLWLTLGIAINLLISQAPGESALQSVNFWPFFLFFAALATVIPTFKQPLATLHTWALALLLATIPINLRAMVEFYLKSPASIERWMGNPWFNWLYLQEDFGHRADSVFGHPNVMANYVVMIFGLGLGLCAHYLEHQWRSSYAIWVYSATGLALASIYCSGSRNGLLVAGLQILCFGWLMRRHRYLAWAGLGALLAVSLGALVWGIGGRSIAEALATVTLRVDVWQIAAEMIGQHPWLGNGLGAFRLQYEPYTIPIYDWVAHSHNLILMLAAEMGLPITLGFLLIVGLIVGRGLKTLIKTPFPRPQQATLAAYMLGFGGAVAFTMFDLSFYDARVNVLGWLILAAIQAIPGLAEQPGMDKA
ncbi:MAG: O-antigen ligase family protein [Leptolyngbyaceae cyanobacterium SM2_5_2]|nr:O-antigen ligase family protein [Leptolyngbyaceae cyanobacterium SM2_5_2]